MPDDKNCEKVSSSGEDLYVCDGVLYRPTYHDGDLVYEIVSDDPNEPPTKSTSGEEEAVDVVGLSLTQPMTSGPAVRELQEVLLESGYDPGGTDGVFGSGTKTALLWLQYDYELEQTGTVDRPTAELLGFLPPSEPPADGDASATAAEGEAAAAPADGDAPATPDGEEPPADAADQPADTQESATEGSDAPASDGETTESGD